MFFSLQFVPKTQEIGTVLFHMYHQLFFRRIFDVYRSVRFLFYSTDITLDPEHHYFSAENGFADSVIIFVLSSSCKTFRYGYAKNEDKDLVVLK